VLQLPGVIRLIYCSNSLIYFDLAATLADPTILKAYLVSQMMHVEQMKPASSRQCDLRAEICVVPQSHERVRLTDSDCGPFPLSIISRRATI